MDRSRLFAPRRLARRIFAAAGLLFAAIWAAGATAALADPAARPVVVELYTSQGCSSCPQADAFLGQLAGRSDVLALSLPVTYWDMLGWKDTLASKGNTARQKAYAAAMGRGGVYTPQMIIDGIDDVVGSRVAAVDKDIAGREHDMQALPIHVVVTAQAVHVRVSRADPAPKKDATIWLFVIRPAARVKIGAGENEGRTVTYRNIVTAVKAVGMWSGKPVSLALPRSSLGGGPDDGIAVIVQLNGYGRVIGATPIGWLSTARR